MASEEMNWGTEEESKWNISLSKIIVYCYSKLERTHNGKDN